MAIVRTTLIELEHGNIERVSDGITEHFEYKGKPVDELSPEEWAEIRQSPRMQKFVEVVNQIMGIMVDVWKEVSKQVAVVANQLLEFQKKHEAELKKQQQSKKAKAKKGKTDGKK